MSLYKAHKPICEVRTPYYDSYGNVLWVGVDNYKKGKTVVAYINKRERDQWSCSWKYESALIGMLTIFKVAHGMRMKLTNSRQRCKLFMIYRRPTI